MRAVRAVVQRVSRAQVEVDGARVGGIERGLLVLLGAGAGDGPADVAYLVDKVANLRIFADDDGKMNRSVLETGGGVLAVSQFTLYGDARKGRRPAFTGALEPVQAQALYDEFVAGLRAAGVADVATGVFGADDGGRAGEQRTGDHPARLREGVLRLPIGPFLLRRLGSSVLAVLGVSLLVFVFLHMVPGDPVDHLAGGDATPEQRARHGRAAWASTSRCRPSSASSSATSPTARSGRQCPDPDEQADRRTRVLEVLPVHDRARARRHAGRARARAAARHHRRGPARHLGRRRAAVVSLSGISMPTMWMGPLLIFVFFV